MADADVAITAGTGTKIDTRTVGAGTDEHRQVVVIGDPTTADATAGVAGSGANAALKVRVENAAGAAQEVSTLTADGQARTGSWVHTNNLIFNGTNWDRTRSIGGLPAADADTGIFAVADVPHKTGYAAASVTAQYTTAQTSVQLGPLVGAAQKAVVTSVQIQAGGTTAGAVQVYFGTGAYARGTNRAIFDGEFAPSATSKPGYAQSPPVPYVGAADEEIRVTTNAGITLTVTCWYYIVG